MSASNLQRWWTRTVFMGLKIFVHQKDLWAKTATFVYKFEYNSGKKQCWVTMTCYLAWHIRQSIQIPHTRVPKITYVCLQLTDELRVLFWFSRTLLKIGPGESSRSNCLKRCFCSFTTEKRISSRALRSGLPSGFIQTRLRALTRKKKRCKKRLLAITLHRRMLLQLETAPSLTRTRVSRLHCLLVLLLGQ